MRSLNPVECLYGEDFPDIGWRCKCGHSWLNDKQYLYTNLVFSKVNHNDPESRCEQCNFYPWKLIPDSLLLK